MKLNIKLMDNIKKKRSICQRMDGSTISRINRADQMTENTKSRLLNTRSR